MDKKTRMLKCDYLKSNGVIRKVEMIVLEDNLNNYLGIDLTVLSESERAELLEVKEKYDNLITKNMKAFRNIKKDNIVKGVNKESLKEG